MYHYLENLLLFTKVSQKYLRKKENEKLLSSQFIEIQRICLGQLGHDKPESDSYSQF